MCVSVIVSVGYVGIVITFITPPQNRGGVLLHLHEIVEGFYFHFSLSVCVCVCLSVCAERMHDLDMVFAK